MNPNGKYQLLTRAAPVQAGAPKSKFLLSKKDISGRFKGERRLTVNRERVGGTDNITVRDLIIFLKEQGVSLARVRIGSTFVTSVLPNSLRKTARYARKSRTARRTLRSATWKVAMTPIYDTPPCSPTANNALDAHGLRKWASSAVVFVLSAARAILPVNGKGNYPGSQMSTGGGIWRKSSFGLYGTRRNLLGSLAAYWKRNRSRPQISGVEISENDLLPMSGAEPSIRQRGRLRFPSRARHR